jgi:hypothetical protein
MSAAGSRWGGPAVGRPFGDALLLKVGMGYKEAQTVYSVPESAARRTHTRPLNAA